MYVCGLLEVLSLYFYTLGLQKALEWRLMFQRLRSVSFPAALFALD